MLCTHFRNSCSYTACMSPTLTSTSNVVTWSEYALECPPRTATYDIVSFPSISHFYSLLMQYYTEAVKWWKTGKACFHSSCEWHHRLMYHPFVALYHWSSLWNYLSWLVRSSQTYLNISPSPHVHLMSTHLISNVRPSLMLPLFLFHCEHKQRGKNRRGLWGYTWYLLTSSWKSEYHSSCTKTSDQKNSHGIRLMKYSALVCL